jgi:hypothetical protein
VAIPDYVDKMIGQLEGNGNTSMLSPEDLCCSPGVTLNESNLKLVDWSVISWDGWDVCYYYYPFVGLW